MCKFCDKIYNSIDEFENSSDWSKSLVLVKDNNKIKLYYSCEDSYYSACLMEVNYCPICGKSFA